MTHITIEEFIDFVSIEELNDEAKALAAKVNGHILECSECLEKARAFQTIYDAMGKIDSAHIEKAFSAVKKKNAEL